MKVAVFIIGIYTDSPQFTILLKNPTDEELDILEKAQGELIDDNVDSPLECKKIYDAVHSRTTLMSYTDGCSKLVENFNHKTDWLERWVSKEIDTDDFPHKGPYDKIFVFYTNELI